MIYILALVVLGVISTIGMFSSKFKDTLLQRISLAGVALSCAGFISSEIQNKPIEHFDIFIYSLTVYAIATVLKIRGE